MDFDGGFKLEKITDNSGKNLTYKVNETMMRIELPKALKKGQSFSFKIKYNYNINDRLKIGGRSGYEYFENEDNSIYTIAQFFLEWRCIMKLKVGKTNNLLEVENSHYHLEITK